MAQEVQIVPKFQHSHVETIVNDYTQYTEAVTQVIDSNVNFISVFRSSQGIDNVLVKKTDLSDFTKAYGASNYKKYGQPLMMPIATLKSGNANVYCMRVMPDDALYANSVLCMLYKKDEAENKFVIKYVTKYVTDCKSQKVLTTKAKALKTLEPDEDGFLTLPLITFRTMGRGVYGNDYRWRITRNMDYEADYGIKMFSFEALTTTKGLSKVGTYVGSIYTSPKYSSATLINDIIDDAEVGAAAMDVKVLEENVEFIYDEYVDFNNSLDEENQCDVPDIDAFDPLFGMYVGTDTLIENIEITSDEDTMTVDNVTGNMLYGGDEGKFDSTKYNEQQIFEAEIECFQNAFEGEYDKHILSPKRIPCDVLLDAGYAIEVKRSLAALANLREDCLLYLDAGMVENVANIDDLIEKYTSFNTRNISKDFQHYTVRDTATQKKVNVTMTYFYAQNLATHYKVNGKHIPFVKSYAQLNGHVKNSLTPAVEWEDSDLKEKLYTNRFNYFEAISENTFQRGCQNTAQPVNSDLMEENNMNTLFEIKRILERDCYNNLYNFTSAEDRARFTETEKAKFADWEGRKLQTFDINFTCNSWENERSIVHCYVAVQFRTLNKRTIIEIDVNKRDFTA